MKKNMSKEELEQTRALIGEALMLAQESVERATGEDLGLVGALTVANCYIMVNHIRELEGEELIPPSKVIDLLSDFRPDSRIFN